MDKLAESLALQMARRSSELASKSSAKSRGGGGTTVQGGAVASTKTPSGVTQSGVKGFSKTGSPNWDEACELHAMGLISKEAMVQIASARASLLSIRDGEIEKTASGETTAFRYKGTMVNSEALARAIAANEGAGKAAAGMSLDEAHRFLVSKGAIPKSNQLADRFAHFMRGKRGVGIGAAIGLGAHRVYKKHQDKKETARVYEQMHEAVPELRDHDPAQVQKAYTVLKSFAPTVAKNPLAAGGITKQLVNLGNLADIQTIKSMADVEGAVGRKDGIVSQLRALAMGALQGG